MIRLLLLSGVLLWIGAAILLSRLRWFRRVPLRRRLQPYAPLPPRRVDHLRAGPARGRSAQAPLRDVLRPLAESVGERLAALLGVTEAVAARLERLHSPLDVGGFRLRQLAWSLAALGIGSLATAALAPPAPLAVLVVVGAPALAFLGLEQQIASASARRQQQVFLELPVVAEQLGMLLGAGYSLSGALNRVATRGRGACAQDLRRVCNRLQQGLPEAEALAEWAQTARVEALDRLVAVLSLNRDTGDLGRLLSEEAHGIRRDVHRQLVALAERRGQQVWIPVTVAALLPGALFLAIPFIEALRMFAR